MIPSIITRFGWPKLWMWTTTIEPPKTVPTNKNSAPLVCSWPHHQTGSQFCQGGLFPLPSSSACACHCASISTQAEEKGSIMASPIGTSISSYKSSGAPYKVWNKKCKQKTSMAPFLIEVSRPKPQQLRVVQLVFFESLSSWIIKSWTKSSAECGADLAKTIEYHIVALTFSKYTFGNLSNHRFGPQTYWNYTWTILHTHVKSQTREATNITSLEISSQKHPRAIHATSPTNVCYFGAGARPSYSVYAKFFGILDSG